MNDENVVFLDEKFQIDFRNCRHLSDSGDWDLIQLMGGGYVMRSSRPGANRHCVASHGRRAIEPLARACGIPMHIKSDDRLALECELGAEVQLRRGRYVTQCGRVLGRTLADALHTVQRYGGPPPVGRWRSPKRRELECELGAEVYFRQGRYVTQCNRVLGRTLADALHTVQRYGGPPPVGRWRSPKRRELEAILKGATKCISGTYYTDDGRPLGKGLDAAIVGAKQLLEIEDILGGRIVRHDCGPRAIWCGPDGMRLGRTLSEVHARVTKNVEYVDI